MKITQKLVEKTTAPTTDQRFIRDDDITGFALRVTSAGAKSFVWEGRVRGRVRRITLGKYPDLSVALARTKALELRTAIALGADPVADRAAKNDELTFAAFVSLYMERHAKPHRRTWASTARIIAFHFSILKPKRLTEITADEVARLHQRIGENSGHAMANKAIRLLQSMFNLARDWGLITEAHRNPAQRVKMFKEKSRDRFLSADEMQRISVALTEESDWRWRAYFPLCLLLGTRRSELLSAKWCDIDLEACTWRIPMTKADRPHLLPLPEPAVHLLNSLPSKGSSEWVFPGTGATKHIVEPRIAWVRICKRAGVENAHIHDLRRTLGSWLAAQGQSLPVIGRALNHTALSATQVYARLDLDTVRKALNENAAQMLPFLPASLKATSQHPLPDTAPVDASSE